MNMKLTLSLAPSKQLIFSVNLSTLFYYIFKVGRLYSFIAFESHRLDSDPRALHNHVNDIAIRQLLCVQHYLGMRETFASVKFNDDFPA